MRKWLVALAAALALAGCAHTYRAERQSVVETGLDTSGAASYSGRSETSAREWGGLWPAPPDQLRP
jgi:hypothetical protein